MSPKLKITLILLTITFLGAACSKKPVEQSVFNQSKANQASPTLTLQTTPTPPWKGGDLVAEEGTMVTLQTSMGDIKLEFYSQDAPKAVANFIKLAEQGFYDDTAFHRVIAGFMIQGGDPLSKDNNPLNDGTGGPGYMFEDELNPEAESYKTGYKKGVLAMANAGRNTNGSQFFILLEDYPLPHEYTIFGKVVSGQDVVDKIGAVETSGPPTDRPLQKVVLKKAVVEKVE